MLRSKLTISREESVIWRIPVHIPQHYSELRLAGSSSLLRSSDVFEGCVYRAPLMFAVAPKMSPSSGVEIGVADCIQHKTRRGAKQSLVDVLK